MISERQGPTRSEQTNQILALCQGVIDGSASDGAVRELLDARERILEQARESFNEGAARINERSPENAQGRAAYIQALQMTFDENKKALHEVRAGLKPKGETLTRAMQALQTATERFFVATEAYESYLAAEGPSRHAMQNFLVNMSEAVKRGDLPKDTYAGILLKANTYFASCMQEMRGAPEGEPDEAIAALLAAFGECHDAIVELERYLGDNDERHLERGLRALEEGQDAVADGFALHRRLKYMAGPTSSAVANTFISAAQMLKQGQYSVDLFANDLAHLRAHLADVRGGFEGLSQAAVSTPALQAEVPRALEAFDIHAAAIEAYERYVERRDPADLDRGNAQLIDAIRRLDEAKAAFESIAEREGKVSCPRCGALNATGHRVCNACSAALPWTGVEGVSSFQIQEGGAVDAEGQPLVVTDNMRRVIEDTNRVAAGDISGAQYAATLDWMAGVITQGETELGALPTLVVQSFGEDERERAELEKGLVEDARGMLAEGFAAMRASLDELRCFIDDGDTEHLITGLRAFWDACQQVHQVQRLSEMAARTSASSDDSDAPLACDEPSNSDLGSPSDAVEIGSE